jgi:hypothetical protein
MMAAMIDQFCASYRQAPSSITLDIDDTLDAVHGHQQLSLFNAHYDERCFLPIHIYEGTTGKPVAVILREGKTPGGGEVRTILKHVIGRSRRSVRSISEGRGRSSHASVLLTLRTAASIPLKPRYLLPKA